VCIANLLSCVIANAAW